MLARTLESRASDFRNFNLCPHCQLRGREPFLSRLSEGIPMISRSDGNTYHLLLADRPQPYPAEKSSRTSHRVSICFWYSHIAHSTANLSTIVIMPAKGNHHECLYRRVEFVADILSEQLLKRRRLASLYELKKDALNELRC